MATHSSVLAWKIPVRLQSMGLQSHTQLSDRTHTHTERDSGAQAGWIILSGTRSLQTGLKVGFEHTLLMVSIQSKEHSNDSGISLLSLPQVCPLQIAGIFHSFKKKEIKQDIQSFQMCPQGYEKKQCRTPLLPDSPQKRPTSVKVPPERHTNQIILCKRQLASHALKGRTTQCCTSNIPFPFMLSTGVLAFIFTSEVLIHEL